jgi:hypothetical protein
MVQTVAALMTGFAALAFSSGSFAQSFAKGNNYTIQPLQGQVQVMCPASVPNSGPQTAFYSCYQESISPALRDYFVGPKGLDVDEVVLRATHADGSTRSKDFDYDSQAGRTKKTVNLWVSTLFQRPLLEAGKTRIDWTLTKRGSPVQSGTFEVTTSVNRALTCPGGYYNSMDPNDCVSSMNACNAYFAQQSNCQ